MWSASRVRDTGLTATEEQVLNGICWWMEKLVSMKTDNPRILGIVEDLTHRARMHFLDALEDIQPVSATETRDMAVWYLKEAARQLTTQDFAQYLKEQHRLYERVRNFLELRADYMALVEFRRLVSELV